MAVAMTTLDDRIEEILSKNGWSTRELAKKAGLSESTVQQIRRRFRRARPGDKPSANAETIKALAKAAGVTVAWLSGSDDQVGPLPAPPAAGGERYPNRETALRALGEKLHPRARDVIETTVPVGDDPSVEAWLELAKTWHRRALELERELTSIEEDVDRQRSPAGARASAPAGKPGGRPPPRA